MDSFEELDIGVETLTYTGNNEMGKILFSKLQQNDIDDKFLELQKCSEILLDYTELSCTEKYGYIFSAPLKNKKTGIIESYLIFRTVNEADINPNNTKLDQSILIDQDFLNNLNGLELYLYSSRFLQYKNQGLEVSDKLCDFVNKWNNGELYTEYERINFAQNMEEYPYKVYIKFDIIYWVAPPLTAWALSQKTISDIFLKDAYETLCKKNPAIKWRARTDIKTNSAEIWFMVSDPTIDMKNAMWDYMNDISQNMRGRSFVSNVYWGMLIAGPFYHSTLGNGGSIPEYERPVIPEKPEEPCTDEKCPYCLKCVTPTSPNCLPCDCFDVELLLSDEEVALLNDYVLWARPKTPNGAYFPTLYFFEMAPANSGAWTPIYRGMEARLTRIATKPGEWDIRVRANIEDRQVFSEVLRVKELYPSYHDIVNNMQIQTQMTNLWTKTIQNTTESKRQELGCYIYIDAQEKTYKFEEFSGNEAGPDEHATIEVEYPSRESETCYFVGFFHTHTACTYLATGKKVGPSTQDIEATQLLGVVGIVYDYIGVSNPYGSGMMIMPGHSLDDPATYSHFGVYRRPLN